MNRADHLPLYNLTFSFICSNFYRQLQRKIKIIKRKGGEHIPFTFITKALISN